MKEIHKKYLSDGVIFSGALVNAIFICLAMYYYIFY